MQKVRMRSLGPNPCGHTSVLCFLPLPNPPGSSPLAGRVGVVCMEECSFQVSIYLLHRNHSLLETTLQGILLFLVLFADNQLSLNCPFEESYLFFLVFISPFFSIRSQIIVLVSIQLSALETQGLILTVFPLYCTVLFSFKTR